MHIPTLHTLHLTLRPFLPEDAAALYGIYQHDGVLQYFPDPIPPALERVERFVSYQHKHWDSHGYGNWAIVPTVTGQFGGWAGLQYLPETGETEVGYLLDRPLWGRGYATEAALASIEFGFEHFDLPEIIALVHPENAASLRVAEKCGLSVVERKVYWGLEVVRHTIKRQLQREE
jgi:[ribosomal protein S5]-alanine N-acetyltransferase